MICSVSLVTFTNDTMHFVGTSVYFRYDGRGSIFSWRFSFLKPIREIEIVMASTGSGLAKIK